MTDAARKLTAALTHVAEDRVEALAPTAYRLVLEALGAAFQAGAEAMRERAGRCIDDIADNWEQMPISAAYREIARSVRSLPLPTQEPSDG